MGNISTEDFKILLSKIQKLNAMAASANVNEASIASRKAHELLMSYNISIEELNIASSENDMEEYTYDSGYSIPSWKIKLLNSMASYYYCQCYIFVNSKNLFGKKNQDVRIVGKQHNIIIAKEMIGYILNAIERMTLENDPPLKNKKATTSYQEGIASCISEKIKQFTVKDVGSKSGTELAIRVNNALDTYLNDKYKKLPNTKIPNPSEDDLLFQKGFDDARVLTLNLQVKGMKYKDHVAITGEN